MLNYKTRMVNLFAIVGFLYLPFNSVLAQDDFEVYRRLQMEGAQQDKHEFQEDKAQSQQKSNQIIAPPAKTDEIKKTDSNSQYDFNSTKNNEPKVEKKQRTKNADDELEQEIEAHKQ